MKFLVVLVLLSSSLNAALSDVVHQSACSGTLTNRTGSFKSPELLSQPGFYPDMSHCKWKLILPRDGNVTLTFSRFHTEACCDYVKITNEKGELIGQYSGRKLPFSKTISYKKAHRIDIVFKSDSSMTRSGFLATYVIHGLMESGSSSTTFPANSNIKPTVPGRGRHSLMEVFLKMSNALTRIMNAVIATPKIHNTKDIVTFKSELYQGLKNIERMKSVSSPALTKDENIQINLVLKHLNKKAKVALLKLEPRLSVAVCQLPKVVGPCRALFRRYYYDQKAQRCRKFDYGGCQGNGNNFEKRKDCEKLCVDTQKSQCPPGEIVFHCFADPCSVSSCPAYITTSRCESDYCNGCNSNYYDQHGIKIPFNRCHCAPDESTVTCVADPCQNATCAAHPNAKCRTRRCESCIAEFVSQNGTIITNC